jgi:serine/threonine-protein kinase
VGRYTLHEEFSSGGMGTVHFGRRAVGSKSEAVAIKRLHPHLRREEVVALMLLDEARMAMRVHHANVVEMLDVVETKDELLLVMEYVPGVSLASLLDGGAPSSRRLPVDVAIAIAVDALRGLHAAHEAVGDDGRRLGIVHRDVSPHNLIVGADGVT